MVGAIRKERAKTSGPYKIQRKVHFEKETTDILTASTPVKRRIPVLVAGAESHRLQKKRGASEARRRSGGLNFSAIAGDNSDDAFSYTIGPYPRTPIKKTHTRQSLAMEMSVDKFVPSSKLQDPSSSPFGKTMGKPDVSDFSDMPSIPYLDAALSSSVGVSFGTDKRDCRYEELERENNDLHRRYDALYKEHQALLALVKDMPRTRMDMGPDESMHEAGTQEGMVCDADNEFEWSQASTACATFSCRSPPYGAVTPVPALGRSFSTSPSSSTAAEVCTPDETPSMPVRVIDEDYDEGYDGRAFRLQQVRANVACQLGLRQGMSMEETLDRLTDALSKQWNIQDDTRPSNIVFPPLEMPSLPVFEL